MDEGTRGQGDNGGPPKRAKTGGRQPSRYRVLLMARGLSARTCDTYVWHLNRVQRFCETEGTELDRLDEDGLERYLGSPTVSAASRRDVLSALRHYFEAIERTDHPAPAPAPRRRSRIGRRSTAAVRALLERRRLSSSAVENHLRWLGKAERYCAAEGLTLDSTDTEELGHLVASIAPATKDRAGLQGALAHYFEAIERSDVPSLGEPVHVTVAGRPEATVRELLERRRLSERTVEGYLAQLRRLDRWCAGEDLELDRLDLAELIHFAGSLRQSRRSLMGLRGALRHYWAAIGRRNAPVLDVVALLGRSERDPAEGRAALERARRSEAGAGEAAEPTWPEMGWDRGWLLDRLLARHLTRKTARNYLAVLARFGRWCAEIGTTIDTANGNELEEFAQSLPGTRSSLSLLRSSLTHYWAITGREDPPLWAVRVPRKRSMRCRALDDDVAAALEGAAVARGDLKGLAVVIGLYLGLRRFEIAKLRWSDFEDGWLKMVGKGDLEAELPVHPVVLEYLARMPRESPFIFPGRWLGPIHPTTLWGWVRDVAEEAGLEAVPTHVLRHTALALGNDATGDLRAVQDYARHARPETTAGYTRSTTRQLIKVADAIADTYRPPPEVGAAPGPGVALPSLSFAELVATTEGAHAVRAWTELATLLSRRPGWRLAGSLDGSGLISFEYSPLLSATAITYTNDRPAIFSVHQLLGGEDFDAWRFESIAALGAVIEDLERGHPPCPPDTEVRIPAGPRLRGL